MMEISENTVGLWWMKLGNDGDWMAHLYKEESRFVLQYRFRYYNPDVPDPFSNKDKKRWFKIATRGHITLDDALEQTRELIKDFERRCGEKCDEILMENGNVEDFMKRLQRKEYVHIKNVPLNG